MKITDDDIAFVVTPEWGDALEATNREESILWWRGIIDALNGAACLAISLDLYTANVRATIADLIGVAYKHLDDIK